MAVHDVGIRHLRAFLAVADTLSFSQAALQLGTNQSSLTRSIRRLEEMLNTRLFNRTTRHVSLSESGERLRDDLVVLLPRLETALVPDTTETTLRLGFSWLLPDGWVQAAIARFEEETGVGVDLVHRDERLAGVDRETVDVALVRGRPTANGMHVVEVDSEPCVAAVLRTSPLAAHPRLRWADLADHPLVLNACTGSVGVEDWPEGHRPRKTVTCHNFDECLELVAMGKGIGLIPELVLRRQLHPAVRFIPIAGAPDVPLNLVHPIHGTHPLARRFTTLATATKAAGYGTPALRRSVA
ncbi:LysR family transcriptional regulator [Streptomyces monticola]|uniref:LysR family transcriptional regulator n=1 Tax=Streptomyces monticola TaxID=2666263 RepID=A0ABW2JHC4_9ACTN